MTGACDVTFTPRNDIPPLEVAERWLNGESIRALAAAYSTSHTLIQNRLSKARKLRPDLPWHKRDDVRDSAAAYVRMTDGKSGAQVRLQVRHSR